MEHCLDPAPADPWPGTSMRAITRLLVTLALVALIGTIPSPAPAAAATPNAVLDKSVAGPKVTTKFAILVDARTGDVLWSRRPTAIRPPASLTKMLTAVLVRASLPLDAVAVAGKDTAKTPPSKLALKPGQKITVKQALEALMIVSANDMAVLLADRSAGSVQRFERAMNLASTWLGLRQSSWRSPNGLDTPGHLSSALDLAILARSVLRDPWLAKLVRMPKVVFTTPDHHRHELYAHSRFMREYKGAVGIKTGFTDDAGHCLAAAATRSGRTLIAIVLDSATPPADAEQLMNWGFGPGRAITTGQVLPAYVPTPSVRTLLAPAPTTATTPPPAVGAGASALDRAGSSSLARQLDSYRVPLGIGGGSIALVAGAGYATRRRRRRGTLRP
jgi:D-alanyl-D-alanine carboxypeptidase (penicillin-binding protein 5/6)